MVERMAAMKNEKCGSHRWRHAFRSAAFVAVATILTLAVNAGSVILTERLNLRADVSKEQYTALSEETKSVLKQLNRNVYLYYTGGAELDDLRVISLLKNYAAAALSVSYHIIDPSAYPGFTQLYDPEQTGIEMGSVIVSDSDGLLGEAPKRYKVLSKNDLYKTSASYYDETGNLVSDYRYFCAESKITSSINYIMSDKNDTAVFLSGQGETRPCENLLDDLRGQFYGTDTSDLSGEPLDPQGDTLIVISPQSDLSEDACNRIEAFLGDGGKAMFFMDALSPGTQDSLSRFEALLTGFALSARQNVVIGEDPAHTYMSRINLIPRLNQDSVITAPIAKEKLTPVLSFTGAIEILSVSGVDTDVLLETDKTCYAKDSEEGLDIYSKQEGDETGSFVIGSLAKKEDAIVVLYGSSSFVTSDEYYGIPGNQQLFLNTLRFLSDRQESGIIPMQTVYSASDNAYKLDISSEIEKVFYIGLAAAVMPLTVLLIGFSKWYRRRRT